MNTEWIELINNSRTEMPSIITGEWFVIRFTPDLIAGELFNIGIVFVDDFKKCHYRLLDDVDVFNCMFGRDSVSNIRFMFSIIEELLSKEEFDCMPSPHITYSIRQTARGFSVDSILDDLYNSMISLICSNDKHTKESSESFTVTTPKLRKHIFSEMKTRYKYLYEKAYNDKPIRLKNPNNGRIIEVDIPINYNSGLESNIRKEYYASIISAAYINSIQRVHQLSYVGTTNILNLCDLVKDEIAKVALIIYLPEPNKYFSETSFLEAERDLDKCLYPLSHLEKEVTIEIKRTEQECLKTVVDFIHS